MTLTASICISAYGDPLFLSQILKVAEETSFIKEILVFDGPFQFCKDIYKDCGYYTSEDSSPIKSLCKGARKTHYHFEVFENEHHKRTSLYEKVTSDLAILLDCDEVIQRLDLDKFESFWSSGFSVAALNMTNIISSFCKQAGSPRKYAIFKRCSISPEEHINYTWLVNVQQGEIDKNLLCPSPLADVDHFFLLRTKNSLVQKLIFYKSLYYKSHNDLVLESLESLCLLEDTCYSTVIDDTLSSLVAAELDYNGLRINSGETEICTPSENARIIAALRRSNVRPFLNDKAFLPAQDHKNIYFPIHFATTNVGFNKFLIIKLEANSPKDIVFSLATRAEDGFSIPQNNNKNIKHTRLISKKIKKDNECTLWHVFIPLTEYIIMNSFELILSASRSKAPSIDTSSKPDFLRINIFSKEFSNKKLRIGGFGNCQIESILSCINSDLEVAQYFEFIQLKGRLVHIMSDDDMKENLETISTLDVLIVQPVQVGYRGSVSINSEAVLKACGLNSTTAIMIPSLYYNANNPFTQTISFVNSYIEKPSPLQDLNLVYFSMIYDKHIAYERFIQLIDNPSTISEKSLNAIVGENISELSEREDRAILQYSDQIFAFISYVNIIETSSNKFIHYSDAHPVDDIIKHISQVILETLGFRFRKELFGSYEFMEKGMFPLYSSIKGALSDDSPILSKTLLNNTEIDRSELIYSCIDSVQSKHLDNLGEFINKYGTKIYTTNHKTGSKLIQLFFNSLATNYSSDTMVNLVERMSYNNREIPDNLNFNKIRLLLSMHCQHTSRLYKMYPYIRHKTLHVVRNPIDIIFSGVRYHSKCDEDWCHKKVFRESTDSKVGFIFLGSYLHDHPEGEYTYQQILNRLDLKEQILFEIEFHSLTHGTIDSISDYIDQYYSEPSIMIQPLETINSSIDRIGSFMHFSEFEHNCFRDNPLMSSESLQAHITRSNLQPFSARENEIRTFISASLIQRYPSSKLFEMYELL